MNSHRQIGRRQFLQGAAMGIAGIAFAPNLPSVLASSDRDPDEVDVVSGPLVASSDGWLEIARDNGQQRFLVDSRSTFWKGGETSPSRFSKGDDVMVRYHVASTIVDRAWSNLARAKGRIIGVRQGELILRACNPHSHEVDLTVFLGPATGVDSGRIGQDRLREGNYLDAIGESTPEGLRATLAWLTSEEEAKNAPTQVKQGPDYVETVTLGDGILACWCDYYGHATWFTCSGGRCGNCSSSNSNQIAWPSMDNCGCCSWNCCDCSKNCKNQEYKSCGNQVSIYDRCSAKYRGTFIADCGPCQKANCSGCSPERCSYWCGSPNCLPSYNAVVADLTRSTFAYFYNPDQRGCFSVRARTQCLC